jgi:hypothetical protein
MNPKQILRRFAGLEQMRLFVLNCLKPEPILTPETVSAREDVDYWTAKTAEYDRKYEQWVRVYQIIVQRQEAVLRELEDYVYEVEDTINYLTDILEDY